MSYIISRIALTILIPIALVTSAINGVKNLINSHYEITEETKKELFEFLDIKDAPSFKFIHKKGVNTDSSFHCLELKFEISKEDYEKNGLNYGDSWQEILFACNYIEKQDNDIYTCVVRCIDHENNKEFYDKLHDIEIEYDK